MVNYEVTLVAEHEHIDRLDIYMLEKHINEVLSTGYFSRATYFKQGEVRRTVYESDDLDSLNAYLESDAERLRDDFVRYFPAGVKPSREIWYEIRRFDVK